MNPSSPNPHTGSVARAKTWEGPARTSTQRARLQATCWRGQHEAEGARLGFSLCLEGLLPPHTFFIVSSMDLPPFHGLVDLRIQLRLAMLCHFRSSSFLWKALASIRTLSYK